MVKIVITLVFNTAFLAFCFGQKYTVSGTITDINTGEACIGVSVYNAVGFTGSSTNVYGFYSIELPRGEHTIVFSAIGYKTDTLKLSATQDIILNKTMQPQNVWISEVAVKGSAINKVKQIELSVQELKINTIKSTVSVMGESDVIKTLQLLPGVQTVSEGSSNLSVRGGSFDQNLILLDGAPVYNPSHALGFFSTFNPDALKSVKMYTGAYPVEYGGRVSSVIDIRMKEGNNQNTMVTGAVGLIASRLTIETPIIKDRMSILLSGRYSYAGTTVNKAGEFGSDMGMPSLQNFKGNNEIEFYDLNFKTNYKINRKNHLYLSAYAGRDHFFYYLIDANSTLDWGNITQTLRWNRIWGSKLFSNLTVLYSKYDYAYVQKEDVRDYSWSSNLQEIDLKIDFDYYLNSRNHLNFGYAIENHFYEPGKIEPRSSESITKPFSINHKQSVINSIYISNQQTITKKIKVDYGLRFALFAQLGSEKVYTYGSNFIKLDSTEYGANQIVKSYSGLEPRLSIRYLLNEQNSVKLSYSINRQYQHLVSNSSLGLPTDVWLPCDSYLKPITSNQFVIGYYRNNFIFFNNISIESYYKHNINIIDYKENANLSLNPNIETEVLSGESTSYGIEFMLKKDIGKLTGWVSYTLSKTSNTISEINKGQAYLANFDKRHNLSVVAKYALTTQWSLSSTFKFTSGGFITVPEGSFFYYGSSFTYYTSRNGYQLPNYHRLDLALNFNSKRNKNRRFKTNWNFGVYNVYNRHNVFSLFVKQDAYNLNANSAYKMYLYGVVPFVNFNFKF